MDIQTNKHTVLIVEDDFSQSKVIHEKLVHEGFIAFQAKNGEEGLIVALQERPELILLDLVMPKMDGITMLKRVREANEWGKNVRVIIFTNLSETGKIASDLSKYGVYAYIVKAEYKIEDLITKIKEMLSKVQ